MFANEKLLQQTPRFTVCFMSACLLLHGLAYMGYLDGHSLTLDVNAIVSNPAREVHRLFTSPFICDKGNWKSILLMMAGLHVGTWFVIAATKSRWQKMLMTYFYNYLAICLVAYFIAVPAHLNMGMTDPFSFPCPQLPLLVA